MLEVIDGVTAFRTATGHVHILHFRFRRNTVERDALLMNPCVTHTAHHRESDMKTLATGVLITLSLAAFAAQAQAYGPGIDVVLKFDRTALDTTSGDAELYGRLRIAAQKACQHYVITGAGVSVAWHIALIRQRCIRETIANTVEKINHPALTAYVQGQSVPLEIAAARVP